ncbi:tyrosine-type recombinase/integrase [Nocardia farcinica]|uniref:Site-specific tyrosine recombinase XerC n=1 Tax=Nocardia farcinica TaxID=37329 RepID=A0A0H5NQJ5_NOCFR|nr:site-specific integrase [Nocardia farcinica]AXK85722.1 site-specific integrase [Nocardia farcinica]PFW99239.1 putative prophage phiRv2 integrase [Nocardia farcinica]PFX00894.1 putative prophage phiRv2 integrase [Nocardia farcinica]CRY77572.1 site-specific tyrosine recombinase XerC [Nocardia farcinica]SIT31359.1 Site-specific recombinase XerD [Nocardia farcinica]
MAVRRNRRAGVEDLWTKEERCPDGTVQRVPSKLHGKGKRWRARYVDDIGQEHTKRFARKTDAQTWLDSQVSSLVQGAHVAPRDMRRTVSEWCDLWLKGYANNRDGTVRQARVHIAQINAEFGNVPLAAIRPSAIKTWTAKLKARGHEPSYIYALHSRLSQILSDAVLDGVLARNPCSRRTAPPMGKQKVYCATTEQVWALYELMPEHLRPAILLGAFAGLRISEACGLRVQDVDFVRGVVHPKQQWPARELKTDGSAAPIPIPRELALMLASAVQQRPGERVLTDDDGKPVPPWQIDRALRAVRAEVVGLPEEFGFQDLRHYLASLLIANGANIKVVQARMRHATAKTTLDTYGHLWPDADESTRRVIAAVITERVDSIPATAYPLRTERAN